MAEKKRKVRVRRVYEEPERGDGTRVLVDGVWPRGESKEKAALDAWQKDVAPSTELRKWYGHDPDKYAEFADRYRAELATEEGDQALRTLHARVPEGGTLTLLTATKDLSLSHAQVLVGELARLD
ncbi:DUF488 domain-containing protein [Streptomyces iconiensis]|uniref:DUF488 family protein n=1 Tax=Streptomyces iconiensis TaxID=1384038 RepID=A0ABT6ZTB4_9ACTN|nr:DUF488 family protein [Streptomyces iconiensis]MDJ1132291.1 DUF488 family protein [Streptomyces iconiensis]